MLRSGKGYNQVDLAVGVTFMILILGFAVIYTNSIITPQINEMRSKEIANSADSLADTVFSERGIPADWPDHPIAVRPSLMEYIYRTPINIKEWNGTSWTDVVVSVNITTDEHAWKDSVKVYEGNTSLPTEIEQSGDADSDGWLDWMNVSFQLDVDANDDKIVYIYYSEDNTTSASYSSLTQDADLTFNITALDEERLEGVTPKKLNGIHNTNVTELKAKFGTDRNMRIEVENVTGSTYIAGDSIPDTTTVAVRERRLLAQNGTAHINEVRGTLWIW